MERYDFGRCVYGCPNLELATSRAGSVDVCGARSRSFQSLDPERKATKSYAALRSARCCKSTEGYLILSTISLRTSKAIRAAFYNPNFGIYGVRFFHPGDDHGAAGVGPAILYYDGVDGRSLGARVPWVGTAADIFLQAQFPVHSGRILGLPGRILVSFMGFVTMVLSVTGVVIWWRKRAARVWRKSARTEELAFAGGSVKFRGPSASDPQD